MKPLLRETFAEQLERLQALDAVAEPLQKAVRRLIPQGTRAKDALSGTWLGHPLHPLLTDVVVGAWTSAFAIDLLADDDAEAADTLIGLGILAALPTALSGASDWAELRGGTRRVGVVHAAGNTTALVLHTLSWRARRRGDRAEGVRLSTLGMAAAVVSAWLGGHLSFGRGVGVNQTAFERLPDEWTAVAEEHEVPEAALVGAVAGTTGVLLVRHGGTIHALVDRCSHRGCSLSKGRLEDATIVCPCHGSTFGLDGEIVRGPATAPQPSLEVRVESGRVEVRAAQA